MTEQKLERFFARILFVYRMPDGSHSRPIFYAYHREVLDSIKMKKDTYYNSEFIGIGDVLIIENHKCKVVDMNFLLQGHIFNMHHGYGVNLYSPTDPEDYTTIARSQ